MAKKIKIFDGYSTHIEEEVNKWLKEENPSIVDMRYTANSSSWNSLIFLYESGDKQAQKPMVNHFWKETNDDLQWNCDERSLFESRVRIPG